MVEPYLVVCGLLLLGSVLARALPADRRSFDDDYEDGWDLSPRELAYLRRGPYGVVLTVLAELHGEGAVDLSRRGPVRRLDPPRDCDDRVTVAVYSGLRVTRRPRLLALLPRVRRACAPLRWDLRERALVPPIRRRAFAAVLLVYAIGLGGAVAVEDSARGSTVVRVLAVWAVAALLLVRGPRRTLAGNRELAAHRAALARVAEDGLGLNAQAARPAEAVYLSDLVAAYGVAAMREVCGGYVAAGALAPPRPSYEPRPATGPVVLPAPGPVAVPSPAATPPPWSASRPRPVAPVPVPVPVPATVRSPARAGTTAQPKIFVPAEPVEPAPWRPALVPVAA